MVCEARRLKSWAGRHASVRFLRPGQMALLSAPASMRACQPTHLTHHRAAAPLKPTHFAHLLITKAPNDAPSYALDVALRGAGTNVACTRPRCRIILAFDNVAAVCGFSYALTPRGAGFARMVDSMKANDFDYRTAQWAVRTRAARSAAQGLRGRLVAR